MKSKYILYARKSSEDKNRQVTSIEDQITELKRLAERLDLNIVEIISESKSAKAPGREGFNRMLELLQKGKAEGILCWKLDRLARNPIDHGKVAWMLQNEVIQRIYTHSNEYKPSDNVLMMQVEFGMATQYVRDLNVNVSRGTRQKAERGWCPSSSLPLGYLHNHFTRDSKSDKEIIIDKERYPIVRTLWEMLLTGKYSVADIKREGDKLGLVSLRGKEISMNSYHLLFRNPFYVGYFYWKDEDRKRKQYAGKHQKMVSIEEFQKAQEILEGGSINKTRVRNYTFPYRGLMSCGECGGYVTAEYIHQVICTGCKTKFSIKTSSKCRKCGIDYYNMKSPSEVKKKYYRCSKKVHKTCTQKSIEEKDIFRALQNQIVGMSIRSLFFEWAMYEIRMSYIKMKSEVSPTDNLQNDLKLLEKRFNGLIDMRANGELSREKYQSLSTELENEIKDLKVLIEKRINAHKNLKKEAERNLDRARKLINSFEKASPKEKNRILLEIGYNLKLKDKKVSILTPFWLNYLKKCSDRFNTEIARVQPMKNLDLQRVLEAKLPLNPIRLTEMALK